MRRLRAAPLSGLGTADSLSMQPTVYHCQHSVPASTMCKLPPHHTFSVHTPPRKNLKICLFETGSLGWALACHRSSISSFQQGWTSSCLVLSWENRRWVCVPNILLQVAPAPFPFAGPCTLLHPLPFSHMHAPRPCPFYALYHVELLLEANIILCPPRLLTLEPH